MFIFEGTPRIFFIYLTLILLVIFFLSCCSESLTQATTYAKTILTNSTNISKICYNNS